MKNAALSRTEKSPLLAGVQGSFGFPFATTQMRRLFDPLGGPARQDVLTATIWDMDTDEGDLSYEARKPSNDGRPRGDGKNHPEGQELIGY